MTSYETRNLLIECGSNKLLTALVMTLVPHFLLTEAHLMHSDPWRHRFYNDIHLWKILTFRNLKIISWFFFLPPNSFEIGHIICNLHTLWKFWTFLRLNTGKNCLWTDGVVRKWKVVTRDNREEWLLATLSGFAAQNRFNSQTYNHKRAFTLGVYVIVGTPQSKIMKTLRWFTSS